MGEGRKKMHLTEARGPQGTLMQVDVKFHRKDQVMGPLKNLSELRCEKRANRRPSSRKVKLNS